MHRTAVLAILLSILTLVAPAGQAETSGASILDDIEYLQLRAPPASLSGKATAA